MDKDLIEQILKDYSKMAQNETTESRLDRIETKIDKLLVGLEEIKKDSQRLTDESVALIHKEYKKALGEFKDIKELDIQSYLNKIDE